MCDDCAQEIMDPRLVQVSNYHFHASCFNDMRATKFIDLLGWDKPAIIDLTELTKRLQDDQKPIGENALPYM